VGVVAAESIVSSRRLSVGSMGFAVGMFSAIPTGAWPFTHSVHPTRRVVLVILVFPPTPKDCSLGTALP
jgi:hypothetical protein